MPPAGFKLAIPANEWLQTHALDRSATGIGISQQLSREIKGVQSVPERELSD